MTSDEEKNWSKSFAYTIHHAHFLIERRLVESLQKASKISFSQFLILMGLECNKSNKQQSQKSIADFLFITEATVSRHIESLTKAGFLTRKDNPDSRREYVIMLTKKGQEELEKAKHIIIEETKRMFSPIDDKEKRSVSSVFERIVNHLQQPN